MKNPIERRQMDDNWHLDKKVPLGLIFAMVMQIAVIVWIFAELKKDVEVLKVQVIAQRDRDAQQDAAQARQLAVVTSWLERMDGKLDRLIEKK